MDDEDFDTVVVGEDNFKEGQIDKVSLCMRSILTLFHENDLQLVEAFQVMQSMLLTMAHHIKISGTDFIKMMTNLGVKYMTFFEGEDE